MSRQEVFIHGRVRDLLQYEAPRADHIHHEIVSDVDMFPARELFFHLSLCVLDCTDTVLMHFCWGLWSFERFLYFSRPRYYAICFEMRDVIYFCRAERDRLLKDTNGIYWGCAISNSDTCSATLTRADLTSRICVGLRSQLISLI